MTGMWTRWQVRTVLVLLAVGVALPASSGAEVVQKTGTFGGTTVQYHVLLPDGYQPSRTYPAVLVFTGGPQTFQMAGRTIDADWRAEAERRGYIVISPGTPDGSLFFQGADRIFPAFLDQILRDYKVQGGKLHVAGHSNGGLSAFHIAARHPQYFVSVTGYPGLLDGADMTRMAALQPFCIFMHVGDRDPGWSGAMEREAEQMRQRGYRVRFTVEKNQVHRLRAQEIDLSRRLFDQIESCR
ncbi:MAG: alpha/beta hydrolase-fold protein [Vicinamibacterales bacterium]